MNKGLKSWYWYMTCLKNQQMFPVNVRKWKTSDPLSMFGWCALETLGSILQFSALKKKCVKGFSCVWIWGFNMSIWDC